MCLVLWLRMLPRRHDSEPQGECGVGAQHTQPPHTRGQVRFDSPSAGCMLFFFFLSFLLPCSVSSAAAGSSCGCSLAFAVVPGVYLLHARGSAAAPR